MIMILSMDQVGLLKRSYFDYTLSKELVGRARRELDAYKFILEQVARELSQALFPFQDQLCVVDPLDVHAIQQWERRTSEEGEREDSRNQRVYRLAWRPRNLVRIPWSDGVIELHPQVDQLVAERLRGDMSYPRYDRVVLVKRGWDTEARVWVMGE